MSEQRRQLRRRVLKAGKIGFNRGSVIDCTVRNISEHGALLQVASPLGIPDSFELELDGEKILWKCRVIWRKERQIGVEFQG
jgi:PilZ domain-containing protein